MHRRRLTARAWRLSVLCSIVALAAALPVGGEEPPSRRGGAQPDLLSRLSLTSQKGPVNISANELELDYPTRTLTYRGNVEVSQADLKMTSDTLRVILDEQAREIIREVTAEGHVRIEQGQRVATGGKAVFDQARRTVTLSENAVLSEGQSTVAGKRVVVYLDEQRSVVEGGDQRVHAVLYPKEIEQRSKSTPSDNHER